MIEKKQLLTTFTTSGISGKSWFVSSAGTKPAERARRSGDGLPFVTREFLGSKRSKDHSTPLTTSKHPKTVPKRSKCIRTRRETREYQCFAASLRPQVIVPYARTLNARLEVEVPPHTIPSEGDLSARGSVGYV